MKMELILKNLTKRQEQIMRLHLQKVNNANIAKKLNVSRQSIGQQIKAAIKRLKKILK